jgi:hypothetical protein
MKRDHHVKIAELLKRAKNIHDAMRRDFEVTFEGCNKQIQERAKAKLEVVDARIITRTRGMMTKTVTRQLQQTPTIN